MPYTIVPGTRADVFHDGKRLGYALLLWLDEVQTSGECTGRMEFRPLPETVVGSATMDDSTIRGDLESREGRQRGTRIIRIIELLTPFSPGHNRYDLRFKGALQK